MLINAALHFTDDCLFFFFDISVGERLVLQGGDLFAVVLLQAELSLLIQIVDLLANLFMSLLQLLKQLVKQPI